MGNRLIKYLASKVTRHSYSKKPELLAILVSIILTTNACYYDIIIEEEIKASDDISFSDDITPLFQSTCVSCHDGTTAYPDLTKNNAYSSLQNGNYISTSAPDESILITKLNSGHPYENALSNIDIERLIRWMETGALDN